MAECQIDPLMVNFHLQKNLEIFIKNQLTKSDQKGQGDKNIPSMPIRVKMRTICGHEPIVHHFSTFYIDYANEKIGCFSMAHSHKMIILVKIESMNVDQQPAHSAKYFDAETIFFCSWLDNLTVS